MITFFSFIDLDKGESKQFSSLSLAFVGDAVYEMLVRSFLMNEGNQTAHNLHYAAVKYVQASAQSAAVEYILPCLTEEEEGVYRRGKNANSSTIPKNAVPAEYRKATGIEALFGYLFLEKKMERIEELFEIICKEFDMKV